MDIAELIRDLAGAGVASAADDQQAAAGFAEACRRADEDPRERQRISDINDLIDAEDAIYAQALAALDRGELGAAEPLLRSSAEAGIGDAAWLLADVLERCGRAQEALQWYRRAAGDGDPRADEKIAALLHVGPEPARARGLDSGPDACLLDAGGHLAAVLEVKALTVRGWDLAGEPGAGAWRVAAVDPAAGSGRFLVASLDALAAGMVLPDGEHRLSALWRAFDPELLQAGAWVARSHLADACLRSVKTDYFLSALVANMDRWSPSRLEIPVRPRTREASCLAGWLGLAATGGWAVGAGSARPRAIARGLTAADMMLPLGTVPAVAPWTTLHDALDQMLQYEAKALPVAEGADLVGVVTLTDLAQSMRNAGGVPSIQRVETLMRPPATVPADMPASAVMAAAASSPAWLLVVTGPDGAPAGYLTPEALLARTPDAVDASESHPAARSVLLLPGLLEAAAR